MGDCPYPGRAALEAAMYWAARDVAGGGLGQERSDEKAES